MNASVRRIEAWLSERLRRAYGRGVRAHPELKLAKIGTAYGGWVVPTTLIRDDWVVYDAGVAAQLEKSFQEDLKYAKKLTYEAWESRPFLDKIFELFTFPIKQQM